MISSRIRSRDALKDYALRALGAPVLMINVDDDQLEDRIDDALDMFWQYHFDGSVRGYVKHQITQEDIDSKRIKLPPNVLAVLRVLPLDTTSGMSINNLQYVMYMTDIMDFRRFSGYGLSSFTLTSSYLNLVQDMFSPERVINFNMHHGFLTLDIDWGDKIKLGDWIIAEVYSVVDPEEFAEAYGNKWLREYTTQLFKKQWGSNLIKVSGATFSGGMTINGEKIYNDASDEIEKLEDRLRNEYAYPVDFFVG